MCYPVEECTKWLTVGISKSGQNRKLHALSPHLLIILIPEFLGLKLFHHQASATHSHMIEKLLYGSRPKE